VSRAGRAGRVADRPKRPVLRHARFRRNSLIVPGDVGSAFLPRAAKAADVTLGVEGIEGGVRWRVHAARARMRIRRVLQIAAGNGVSTRNDVSSDSSREMSDSKAMDVKLWPLTVGLVNRNELGCSSRSATGLLIEPGQFEVVRDAVEIAVDIEAAVDLHIQRRRRRQAEVIISLRVGARRIAVVGVRAERLQARGAGVGADLAAVLEVPDLVGERDVVGVGGGDVAGQRGRGAELRWKLYGVTVHLLGAGVEDHVAEAVGLARRHRPGDARRVVRDHHAQARWGCRTGEP